jgi:murein DD-endopeptidase MepM/ murein hydrolase activator NlpD
VQRGDTIGRVGATGLAVAPHLHYEVLVNGQFANPRRYLFTTENVPD